MSLLSLFFIYILDNQSYYTQQGVANNITVHTIGLGSGVNSALLTGIATATGGQYFPVASADDLPEVFRTISGELESPDTDGNGIPDITETSGFRDGTGKWYTTDPENADTDGDGLTDGEEAGVVVDVDGKIFFHVTSSPVSVDSDNDGIDDPDEDEFSTGMLDWDSDNDKLGDGHELEIGTEPRLEDTDFDGYSDYDEFHDADHDPLVYEERYSYLEIGREFVLGAVLGEFGYDDHDSFYYLAGHIVSGVFALGDIRDMAASITNGDLLGTLFNAFSVIPLYGDATKIASNIGEFVLKHGDEAGVVAIKYASLMPTGTMADKGILAALKGKTDDLISLGFADEDIIKLVKKGIDPVKFNDAIKNVDAFDNYPGLNSFLKDQLLDDTKDKAIFCTFNVKKAATRENIPARYRAM